MSRNNIPNLSLVVTAPINTINRRQRSNTSPTESLSAFSSTPISDAPFTHPPAGNTNQYYECTQPIFEAGRQDEEIPKRQSSINTNSNPQPSLSSSVPHHTRSLKREANSPVYLDHASISLGSSNNNLYFLGHDSNNCVMRRVAQCNSDRIRSSDSDVTSISSQDDNLNVQTSPNDMGGNISIKSRKKAHGQRNKWTIEETQALVRGCNNFAIGQWKAIRDSEPMLANRSPGDLKDRFRTYFPDAYRKHYPNAKTHISSRVRSVDSNGNPLFGENAVRRERKQFSAEEDAALKRGYVKFGTAWSSIQRDPVLASRKATDLRDRFRNAFPEIYAAAGYKPRSRKASGSNVLDFLADPNQQHGTFEAIDLSVYPPRGISHLHPNQYQLPSLDFLKAHGANAFSDFSLMQSNPQISARDDISPLHAPQLLPTTLNPTSPVHLVNMTPRPIITTPRPNDTTPRPPKSVHKTQSSMNLTEFSNLHLVNSSFNPPITMSHCMHADIYSPSSTDYLEYGDASPRKCSENQFFQVSHQPEGHQGEKSEITGSPILTQLEPDFNAGTALNDSTGWLHDLDAVTHAFPGAFDLSGFVNEKVLRSASGGSFESSMISPDPSKDSLDDKVVYTGDVNNFHQSPAACHALSSQQSLSPHRSQLQNLSLPSPQTGELLLHSHFIENNLHSTHKLPNQDPRFNTHPSNLTSSQLEQRCNLYQHDHGKSKNDEPLNQITLCPSLLTSNLNSPLPCSAESPVSASSAIHPSSSALSPPLISSLVTTQLDLLNM